MQQLRLARMHLIGRMKRVEDSKWDVQPSGFNNNIRWHAGHIFVTMETLIHQSINSYEPKHPNWIPLFVDGTSPVEWGDDVPSNEELMTNLREQLEWVIPFLEGKQEEKMSEPLIIGENIMTIDDIQGIIQFIAWHEGVHAGVIDALSKVS
ncbi:DinB family protein [Sporosarcina sp. FA9]|uniref:DinB family protein n=1 Tax=Sporosarcina sp. FA9 TaxID=3413030 RepID=UPI003F65EAB8